MPRWKRPVKNVGNYFTIPTLYSVVITMGSLVYSDCQILLHHFCYQIHLECCIKRAQVSPYSSMLINFDRNYFRKFVIRTFGHGRNHMQHDTYGSSAGACYSDAVGISTKCGDVPLYPFKSCHLIFIAVVTGS